MNRVRRLINSELTEDAAVAFLALLAVSLLKCSTALSVRKFELMPSRLMAIRVSAPLFFVNNGNVNVRSLLLSS